MDIIVKTTSSIVFPFILLIGVYVAFHGHLTPGGGFSGGAVIASAFALLILTFPERDVERKLSKSELIDIKSMSGIILMILVLTLGNHLRLELLSTQTFLKLWSGGLTPFFNVAGMLMVVTAVVVILYTLVKE